MPSSWKREGESLLWKLIAAFDPSSVLCLQLLKAMKETLRSCRGPGTASCSRVADLVQFIGDRGRAQLGVAGGVPEPLDLWEELKCAAIGISRQGGTRTPSRVVRTAAGRLARFTQLALDAVPVDSRC